ncbi:ATP-binding protein [Streptomyces sp. NPDC047097]|uniref:ATP-binding protein n=1 Tax=Streptomyces sp. NPDC047097 TaxID=3155260 RepID=UPI0033EC912F
MIETREERGPGLREPAVAAGVPQRTDQARDLVAAVLAEQAGDADPLAVADALLVTSEVATNALRHGGGITGFEAAVTRDGPRPVLVVSVADRSRALPVSPSGPRPPGAVGGYGWAMVRRLAAHTATTATADGKVVHVHLPLATGGSTGPPAPAPPTAP